MDDFTYGAYPSSETGDGWPRFTGRVLVTPPHAAAADLTGGTSERAEGIKS